MALKACHKCWNIYLATSNNPWNPDRCGCEPVVAFRPSAFADSGTIPARMYYSRISMQWDELAQERINQRRRDQMDAEYQQAREAARRSFSSITQAEYRDWIRQYTATISTDE